MPEHGLLELAQPRPGLDPELVHEEVARAPVEVERVRLPAGAVEGEHQELARPLAQRLRRDELLELGDDARRLAAVELGLDPVLHGCEPLILEPRRRDLGERLGAELPERRPAPELERLAQAGRRRARFPGRELLARRRDARGALPPSREPSRPRGGASGRS